MGIDLVVGELYNIALDGIDLYEMEFVGIDGEHFVFESELEERLWLREDNVEYIEDCGCRRDDLVFEC